MKDVSRGWVCGGRTLPVFERVHLMGVLNVTPDSFSDGGLFVDQQAAVSRALQMAEEGADIIDVGGESTRPGAQPVSEQAEMDRVVPVIEKIAGQTDALVSIDTTKAAVAKAAIDAGAAVINDVSALTRDPAMARLAASTGAGVVLMHMRGEPRTMQTNPSYRDVVAEVAEALAGWAEGAEKAGIARSAIALDPGIGFGKTLEHNLALIRSTR
ncbi:MAG: dihydropteroate synthase, partial [Actinomycetota bacterium]